MADSNNDSTLVEDKDKGKDSEMDTSTEEKVEEETPKKSDDKKETEEEKNKSEEEEEDESEEEEELPPGLLEQPLEIQGKREKKKVERLSAAMVPKSSEKKKIEIEEGSGMKLGDITLIESKLNSTKAIDLKPLHRLLFQRIGAAHEVKKNIRQFCGFTHSKDSKEQEKRTTMLSKMHIPELKSICLILGLERSGAKKDVVERIMDFLISPSDKDVKPPKAKKAKRTSKSSNSKKETEKGKKRKRKPKKQTKKAKSDDEDDDDDAGSLDDDEEEDEDNENDASEKEEESEDEAPKKKKAKTEPKKKVSEKVNGKKEKAPAKKETKKPSPKKKKNEDTISDDDLSDDSEDEPISMLVKEKSPPSNDEIKQLVEKILDGADLNSVTMKTVVKEVYGKYPTFDLSDRKDFIKNTVREVIS